MFLGILLSFSLGIMPTECNLAQTRRANFDFSLLRLCCYNKEEYHLLYRTFLFRSFQRSLSRAWRRFRAGIFLFIIINIC